MVIDKTGCHTTNDPQVPPNVNLVRLSPYLPELNVIDEVWQCLRDRYPSARLFADKQAIVDTCCAAWNNLIVETCRIQSLTDFAWTRWVN